ncbi:MAG TPA: Ig-like domain-containing protein [Acidimicrobiales bacterium]|nr:Ig-like domain-containing protein [Acidimicrobiales bacterium]
MTPPPSPTRPSAGRRLAAALAAVATAGVLVALAPAGAGAAPGDPVAPDPAPAPTADERAAVATTTVLAASASSVEAGDPLTLTATVTAPGGAPITSGTVELFAGATSLGTAELNGLGEATRAVTFATPGTRAVTAEFLGTVDADPSTSASLAVAVTTATEHPAEPPTQPPTATPRATGVGTGPAGQTLTVTPVDALDPAGTEVEVVGRGYIAAAGFDVATEGMYLALCVDQGPGVAPSPCVGGADTTGATGSSTWVTNNPYDGVPPEAVTAVEPDGSFRATLTLAARDEFVDCLALASGERCVLASRMDHRASADRSQDVKVPVCWAGQAACTTDPIAPADPDAPPAFTGYQITPAGPSSRATTGGTRPTLAATGADVRLLPWGLALLGGGAALLLGSRRARRTTHAHPTGGAPS